MKTLIPFLLCAAAITVPTLGQQKEGATANNSMKLKPKFERLLQPSSIAAAGSGSSTLTREELFRAQTLWDLSDGVPYDVLNRPVFLGSGVDVRYLATDKVLALKPEPYPQTPTPIKGNVEYYYSRNATEVVSNLGGGTSLEASLTKGKIAAGLDFKSSTMRSNQRNNTDGYLVIKFDPEYNFYSYANPVLSKEARELFKKKGLKAFYAKHGTHYVSAARPHAAYALIYTFHAESASSMDSFEQTTGVHLGLAQIFEVGFGDKMKKTLASTNTRITFEFQEYYSSSAGVIPISEPEAAGGKGDPFELFDRALLEKRYDTFLKNLASATYPYTQFKLIPFASILDPQMAASMPEAAISVALANAADAQDLLDDYARMLRNKDVWSSVPTDDSVAALGTAQDKVNFTILDVLAAANVSANTKAMVAASSDLKTKGNTFIKSDAWPKISAIRLNGVVKDPPDTGPITMIDIGFKTDIKLGPPVVRVAGTDPSVVSSPFLVLAADGGDAQSKFWKTAKIKLPPAAGLALRVILTDSVGRIREAVIFSSGDPNTPIIMNNWTEMY